jgi:hypothetical protein
MLNCQLSCGGEKNPAAIQVLGRQAICSLEPPNELCLWISNEKRAGGLEISANSHFSPRLEAAFMAKSKRKRAPRTVLKLPDLEQSKSAVLNGLTSASSQRSYDHAIREFIDWYCSEPRLAFNETGVARYRISLEQRQHASSTINLRLAAVRQLAYEAPDCSVPISPLAGHCGLPTTLISQNAVSG